MTVVGPASPRRGGHHVVFGALHALDGLLILGIAAWLYFWSRRRES